MPHARQAAWFQVPAFYFADAAAIVGPRHDAPVAPGSRMFELELELAAVAAGLGVA